MNKIEILKEIKNLVFSGSKEEEEVVNFKDAKVGDMIIRVDADEFAEGLPVFVVTEEGVIPASPDMAGEHTLEDGTKITLDESGVITKVEKTEVEVEEPEVEEMAEDKVEDLEDVKEEVKEELKEEVKEEMVEEVKEEMKEEVKEDIVTELTSRVEKLESAIEEMLALSKEANNFSKIVEEKLDTFIKDTPAELEFKSIKSEYKSTIEDKKSKAADKLEEIRKFRTKK